MLILISQILHYIATIWVFHDFSHLFTTSTTEVMTVVTSATVSTSCHNFRVYHRATTSTTEHTSTLLTCTYGPKRGVSTDNPSHVHLPNSWVKTWALLLASYCSIKEIRPTFTLDSSINARCSGFRVLPPGCSLTSPANSNFRVLRLAHSTPPTPPPRTHLHTYLPCYIPASECYCSPTAPHPPTPPSPRTHLHTPTHRTSHRHSNFRVLTPLSHPPSPTPSNLFLHQISPSWGPPSLPQDLPFLGFPSLPGALGAR